MKIVLPLALISAKKQEKLTNDGEVTRERSYRAQQNQLSTMTAHPRNTAPTEVNAQANDSAKETAYGRRRTEMKQFSLSPAPAIIP